MNRDLATKIYDTLNKRGAEIGNASVFIIEKVLDDEGVGAEKIPLDAVVSQPGADRSGGPKNAGDGFLGNIHDLADKLYGDICKRKEEIIEAFIAETGLKPSECELVVQYGHSDLGTHEIVYYVRKRGEHF